MLGKIVGCILLIGLMLFELPVKAQLPKAADNNSPMLGVLSEGIRAFLQHDKIGFMDEDNNVLVEPKFYCHEGIIPYFSDGRCLFFERTNSENEEEVYFGFLDAAFNKVIPARYRYHGYNCNGLPIFSSGKAVVYSPNDPDGLTYRLIDKSGNWLGKEFKYSVGCTAACVFYPEISESLIAAEYTYGNFGYVSATSGEIAIPMVYSLAGPFSEGLAAVEVDSQYIIIIDKLGNPINFKRYYTQKQTYQAQNSEEFGPYTMEACGHLGGYIQGKMFIKFFDNEGTGSLVYALIDRNGNVLIKKKVSGLGDIDEYSDPDFKDYIWTFGM